MWRAEGPAGSKGGEKTTARPGRAGGARAGAPPAADPQWEPRRLALADRDGEAELHLAGNAEASSSLLEMRPEHVRVAPEARYVGAERVPLARLDAVALPAASALMLKLDVQGAEAAVLAGAAETLRRVRAVECELSLVELYAGQAMFDDLLAELRVHGLTLWALRPALADPGTGRLLQLDALFVRG
jgi:FkbM family methyltransferase